MKAPELSTGKDKDVGILLTGKASFFIRDYHRNIKTLK